MIRLLVKVIFVVASCIAIHGKQAYGQIPLQFSQTGEGFGHQFGKSIDGIGDVDGDGLADYIVGAPGADSTKGKIYVYSGSTRTLIFSRSGDVLADRLGRTVSAAGDVNGDGIPDFMAGAPLATNLGASPGSVRIYSGADGSTLHTLYGANDLSLFGSSICAVDDFDNDGFDDVLIGAKQDSVNGANSGKASIFSGLTGTILASWSGSSVDDALGTTVVNVGDVTGDGVRDFAIGAPGVISSSGFERGEVKVHSGTDGSIIRTHMGVTFGNFGQVISAAGDFNADGIGDYILREEVLFNSGQSTAFSLSVVGIVSGASGGRLFLKRFGEANYGATIDGGFDLNGDGYDDFVMQTYDFNGESQVAVYSGISGDLVHRDSRPLNYGDSLSIVGDLNGDSVADLIVGRPGSSTLSNGRIYGYFGLDVPLERVTPYYNIDTLSALPDTTFSSSSFGMSLTWQPNGGQPDSALGTLSCTGANPGGIGRFAMSFARRRETLEFVGPTSLLLLDSSPMNVISIGDFGYDIFGEVTIPNVLLQSPFIGNFPVYVQFFQVRPIIRSSNGLRMIIAP